MRSILVDRHGFVEKQNQYGSYFYTEVSSLDSWQVRTVLRHRSYKYKSFDKRYERNNKYRQEFFEHNKGPYHCAYCGKGLRDDYLEVDHLVPVSQAKSKISVRTWLHFCGITNVNDPRNLVASCKKCNRKKSDKMGTWVIRGMIGRHKSIWVARNIIVAICILFILSAVCANTTICDLLYELIQR